MTLFEIMAEIHNANLEIDVLRSLESWLINDRNRALLEAKEARATVKAAKKIAKNSSSKRAAIETIINLCDQEDKS